MKREDRRQGASLPSLAPGSRMPRRDFLRAAALGGAGLALRPDRVLAGMDPSRRSPPAEVGGGGADDVHIVILHTNDTHSRIDPFPMDGGPHQGLGGVARRATLVRRAREEHPNVLLLDSGDVFQGTPYFNFFGGEIELRAMSGMGYDATTLGNHDFDNGVDGLLEVIHHAGFAYVSANYLVDDPALAPWVQPWIVRETGGVKVGIFGLGIAFEGLVMEHLHRGVRYTDPLEAARRAVADLRSQGCSLVVCLSHLGYRYEGGRPSDTTLAREVEGIDLVLGGHTHTFMDHPDVHAHPDGSSTLVHQVGFGGIRLGRVDVLLTPADSRYGPASHRPLAWQGSGHLVDAALD